MVVVHVRPAHTHTPIELKRTMWKIKQCSSPIRLSSENRRRVLVHSTPPHGAFTRMGGGGDDSLTTGASRTTSPERGKVKET